MLYQRTHARTQLVCLSTYSTSTSATTTPYFSGSTCLIVSHLISFHPIRFSLAWFNRIESDLYCSSITLLLPCTILTVLTYKGLARWIRPLRRSHSPTWPIDFCQTLLIYVQIIDPTSLVLVINRNHHVKQASKSLSHLFRNHHHCHWYWLLVLTLHYYTTLPLPYYATQYYNTTQHATRTTPSRLTFPPSLT